MNFKLTVSHYQLPLKYPFTISRHTVHMQETLIVSISDGTITGYGEATANPYYGITIQKLKASIKSVRAEIESQKGAHPETLWHHLEPKLRHDYFALCAIDCAYWDYFARKNKRTLRSFWNNGESNLPKTNYTIGIDEIPVMTEKVKQKPWPIYKIKLGMENDLEIVEALRNATDAVFRIDANCAWEVDEAIQKSKALKALGVEFIEQPLKAENWDGMSMLKKESALPFIADESCKTLEDVAKCAEVFDGINIKLMKCGGITPALKMIEKGRALGLKVMLGCMTESTIGISNLVQLAPLLDYIDADGAMLLASDIASGVQFQNGTVLYPKDFGSGAKLLL
ncbi:dipeptide epimerase [Hyunsoonleella sp. SJ7]|uniref:Dipeptide epimerase n=1 Tax=Hyunsoonleella aquatilis TaxID=2762758 RepID=A0A923H802_9FLAO|nr:dipeptide epimerase [Hyunsoonleella aquatilis]MBC3757623.1 dipeptide epimerase [Hyunsoonleella aquatilis]